MITFVLRLSTANLQHSISFNLYRVICVSSGRLFSLETFCCPALASVQRKGFKRFVVSIVWRGKKTKTKEIDSPLRVPRRRTLGAGNFRFTLSTCHSRHATSILDSLDWEDMLISTATLIKYPPCCSRVHRTPSY